MDGVNLIKQAFSMNTARLLFRQRQMLKPIQILQRHLEMNIASTSTQIRTYRHQIKHQTR